MIVGCCCTCCTGLKEIAVPEKESEGDIWTGPGANMTAADSVDICYVTGIDYPAGWSWHLSTIRHIWSMVVPTTMK